MEIQNFYQQVIEEILLSNQEALELLKDLSVINTELETNIDRKCIENINEFRDIEKNFNELLNTGIIIMKKNKKEIYTFSYFQVQTVMETITDKKNHEKAIKYYERKRKQYGNFLTDEIEVLFHKTKVNLTKQLVNEFFLLITKIDEFASKYKRLLNVAEELIVLDDKYKAPILTILGSMISVIGRNEDAERIYLNALKIYKKLAKKYYKIFLPYSAAAQKNHETIYIDLKRFEEVEKIFSDSFKVYKKLKKQFYDVHSPKFFLAQSNLTDNSIKVLEFKGAVKSYLDDLKAYNRSLKKYYDIYLKDEKSTPNYLGNVKINLNLLEGIKDGSIDSLSSYQKLAKICYDMCLIDIAKTQSNLGNIYRELQKFEESERMHLKALKIKKKVAEEYPTLVLSELTLTLIDLGDLYASLKKFEKAEPMFRQALKISNQLAKKNPEVYCYNVALIHNCLGIIYTRLEKFEEAEPMFIEALRIFTLFAREKPKTYLLNVADVQNNLGNFFTLLGNLKKAEFYLNKALKADPMNGEILYNLACLESLKNNKAKTLELLKKVLEIDRDFIKLILVDNKFDNIRDLKEFKKLIKE